MKEEYDTFAKNNGFELDWDTPITSGDFYLAKRNTGFRLLTCRELGEGCIYPVECYSYFFNAYECVKIRLENKNGK